MFSKYSFLLSKFENKIPSYTFPMKAILSVLDEVKLAVNEMEMPN